MENDVGTISILLCSMLFTGIGVYAWNREKPMWFWSGSTVSEDEISDVEAYNRANGIMWICFSLPLWISTVVGYFYAEVGVALMVADFVLGLPAIMIAYGRIYKKYKR